MSATSGGGGSVSEGSEAGGSSQSTMSVGDSPSTSFQPNLTENVTKITLSEENSAGGFGADVTGSKINLSLDERHQKDGIVNVAFDYEEGAPRGSVAGVVAGGVGGGGGSSGGGSDFKSINGSEKKDKVPEAVNLELVNMVPYSNGNGTSYGVPVNGIPVKKDSEQVDMSTPYDEYFVPVNEHKKYMRGEKLYVTKDKRRPTSWRRCLSWIVACTVISVVLIVAILAGTGVILSQDSDLVKEASVGRNFAGSNAKQSVTNKSPTPTAEMYMYVPRSIESEFVIDNLDYDPAFKDVNSTAYRQFAANMEDQLKMLLFDKETLEFGASNIGLKVVNISRDPFKVNYRIGWNYKQGVNNPPEPIKMEDVKKRLVESLARNQGYIDKYHIDGEAIKVDHVINTCQMENGGCSHICYYDYNNQEFVCTCPTHLILDNTGKNCVAWTGSSEDDVLSVPGHTAYPGLPYESTANPVHQYETGAHYEHGHQHEHSGHTSVSGSEGHGDEHQEHEPVAEPEPTPEPGSDGSSAIHDGHVIHSSHGIDDHEAAPEPTAEPGTKNEYEHSEHDHSTHDHSEHDHSTHDHSEHDHSTHDHSIYNDSDHDMHSVYESKEPAAEPKPEPTAEMNANDRGHVTYFIPESKASEPSAEPTPDTTGEQNAEGRSHEQQGQLYGFKGQSGESTAEPAPEPTAEPTSEGKDHDSHTADGSQAGQSEPVPTTEGDSTAIGHDHVDHSIYVSKDHEPSAEPTPEPTVKGDSSGKEHGHLVYGSKDHEPTAEPTPEPTADGNLIKQDYDHASHSVHGSSEHEPSAEPTPEPIVDENSNVKSDDHSSHSAHGSSEHEPSAEPTPEPTVDENSNVKSDDHSSHSIYESTEHESSAEPTPQPTVEGDSGTTGHNYLGHSVSESKEHEPSAEPTADGNSRNYDQIGHSVHESKEHESTTQPTSGSDSKIIDHNTLHTLSGSVQEFIANQTAESSSGGNTHDLGAQTVATTKSHETAPEYTTMAGVNSKDDSEPHSADGAIPELKTETYNPEPTPEPSPVTESNSGSEERLGTTIAPHVQSNLSQTFPSKEETQGTDYQTQTPTGITIAQFDSDKVNKSTHNVPYLEDILIKKPSPTSDNQHSTTHSQNPLDNVELTEDGKPVIEEIRIDHSGTRSGNESETNLSTVPSQTVISGSVSDAHDSTTQASTERSYLGGNVHETADSTDHPARVGFSSNQNSSPQGSSETRTSGSGPTVYESTFKNQDGSTIEGSTIIPTDQTQNSVNTAQENMPVTTVSPEFQPESQTNPVILGTTSADVKSDTKAKEHHLSITSEEINSPTTLKPGEIDSGIVSSIPGIIETEHSFDTRGTPEEGVSDPAKSRETATEPQVAATTLFTILSPEGVEKITSQLTRDMNGKNTDSENKTVNVRQSEQGGNEMTKTPEEISNNIKDELSENEEFNTLIDNEYKSTPIDGKDTVSKYPNKLVKTEKKKIKDYVKNEKTETTARPPVTPEDFILQKHVNGNGNTFDLDYSLQNEHTTKHDGEVTIIDPHSIPGVSFKPHGINNHDLSVLQTVAPDFRTETTFPIGVQDFELSKLDSRTKLPDNKDSESRTEKDYPKFDKDYKYEKQKVSKKKELKKKTGGKDGKNVELDENRKYFVDLTKDDLDVSHEDEKDVPETTLNPLFEPDVKTGITSEYKTADGADTTVSQGHLIDTRTELHTIAVTELPGFKSINTDAGIDNLQKTQQTFNENKNEQNRGTTVVDQKGHLTVDEPTVKSNSETSPGTVYDGTMSLGTTGTVSNMRETSGTPGTMSGIAGTSGTTGTVSDSHGHAGTISSIHETSGTISSMSGTSETTGTVSELQGTSGTAGTSSSVHETSGTVFDKIPQFTTTATQSGHNTTFVVYQTTETGTSNTTTAHPTIIIHGHSGSLQDGHMMRFANSTFSSPLNTTVVSIFNGTVTHPDGHTFSFTNYTATFPNGSAVHPTIVVRGQSGALQDGHQYRFGNLTFTTPTLHLGGFKNSTVYRIENETFPSTNFDGNSDPDYQMFINSSGTFVYTNATTKPSFIIKGESGDFGNSTAYIIGNHTRTTVPGGFVSPHSVIFRNSTVFAIESDAPEGAHEITAQPHGVTSNETISFTNQMHPSFVSSGTAYQVNDYFGYISKCAAGQFQCVNGTSKRGSACISLSSKCDSISDCSDGSDELGCIENGCPGNFQCADGTCLKRNLVCNGILDCSDASDEKNCESWKCEFDEFQCPSGRCIPVVWQCDGKPDCDNHTDEINCQSSCGNDEYHCPEDWCIPLTYKCNGVKECSNGEDEQLCDCSHEEFKCNTGGCVSMKNVCNGLDDCPDRSDEWDCVKLEPDTNLLKIRSPSGVYEPVCADGWSSRFSDEVCASLGYFSSVPVENESNSTLTTDSSFYLLKNDTTAEFNKKIIVNLRKSEGKCSSGKFVELSCQEFSCGSRSMTDSSSVEARLVGGMSAFTGQWPTVGLLYNLRNFHSCTANILTPRWVLASYNCLKMGYKNLNEQDWKFFGGSTVFEAEKENAETRKILRIIPHPQVKFNQFLFSNDLALVELDQSLQFSSNLGAVCLPEQEVQPRQICVAAGWGMNGPEERALRQQLQYLPVPTMNLTECNSTEHYSGFITDDKICAGYNSAQKSLCYNEEGAPLMCINDKGEWELQGVLSYHSNCGRGSHPSIFSSIAPVSDWIKKTIGNSFKRKALPVTKR